MQPPPSPRPPRRLLPSSPLPWLRRRWPKPREWLKRHWKKAKPGDRTLFVLSGLGLGGLVWLAYFAPGRFGLDATLEVSELRFTYAHTDERTFLNAIDLPRLTLGGHQAPTGQTLTLRGRFTSPDPAQQALLQKRNPTSLTFSLANPNSQLAFTPSPQNKNKTPIALSSLLLQPNTRVDRLAYRPAQPAQPARLELSLSNCTPNQDRPCQLRFRLGNGPLNLNGSAIAITELSNLRDPNLQFLPDQNLEQVLTFSTLKTLILDLPPTAEATRDLFSAGFAINQVHLDRQDTRGQNARDRYTQSTLLAGEARLKDKTLKLQTGQYLSFGDNSPGIQRLERLEISPKAISPPRLDRPDISPPATGLQLFVSGEAQELSAGLNPQLPTQTIDPKWLQETMSDEAIALLVGLCSGVFATLLGRLLEDED